MGYIINRVEIYNELLNLKMRRALHRAELLSLCKTQEEKDKLEDRWALQDASEEIADAIRSTRKHRGLW